MRSWYSIRALATGAEVAIHDEIGAHGVSAKGFLAELGALPGATPLEVRLNSPGGSVFDAVAIHNALQRHEGQVTVWIDGIAASAASYIAMAGDEIVMPDNAFLMIHDPSGLVMGTAGDMRSMAEALDKVKSSLVAGYAAKSGRSTEEVAAIMAAETWFDATEALAQGFADRVVDPVRIAARFDIAGFRNAPAVLTEAVPEVEEAEPTGETAADPADAPEQSAEGGVSDPDPVAEPDQPVVAGPDPAGAETPLAATSPDPGIIRAEVLTHARAVIDLCRLAGQPQMAGRFLEQDTSLDAVRAALLAAKASADPEIAPHHPQPGPGPAARPWGEILARTFKLKG